MGTCCSGPETTAGNAFYEDGDQSTPKAKEEQPPRPKPVRSVSTASLFYNDGDEVVEEKESTSCWGKSSKPKSPPKRPTRPASRAETEKERKGKKKKKRNRRKASAASGMRDRRNNSRDDGNERSNQRMNQVAPEASRFYQDRERIDNALSRRKTMQRAMNQAYDHDDNKSVSSEESDDDSIGGKKKSTSCFAGLCQPKKKTVASNFHNQ